MRNMKHLISVIIPIYNSEEYLVDCIESVLGQTYVDFELILVDDGSTDASSAICDEYAAKDGRIKVIHKDNGGVSSARNCGMEIAGGKYIAFVDSDDWVAPTMLSLLLETLVVSQSQVAICAGYQIRKGKVICKFNYYLKTGEVRDSTSMVRAAILDELSTYATCALFCADCWQDLRFPANRTFEDLSTVYKVIAKSKRVCFVDEPLYYYNRHENSITATRSYINSYNLYLAKKEHYQYACAHHKDLIEECAGCAAQYALSVCFYRHTTGDVPDLVYRDAYTFLQVHKKEALIYKRHPIMRRVIMKVYWYAQPAFLCGCKLLGIVRTLFGQILPMRVK